MRGSRGGTEIARIKIWHNDKDLLYTADPHTARRRHRSRARSHELAEALEGEIEAEIISSSEEPDNAALLERYGTLLEVYVPILYDGDPAARPASSSSTCPTSRSRPASGPTPAGPSPCCSAGWSSSGWGCSAPWRPPPAGCATRPTATSTRPCTTV